MRDRGVRIRTKELANRESFVGELVIYEGRDGETGCSVRIATLHGENQTSLDLLTALRNVEITGAAPLASTLAGFERIQGRRGAVDVAQEWWVRGRRERGRAEGVNPIPSLTPGQVGFKVDVRIGQALG